MPDAPYRNANVSVEDRVEDLLGRMNQDEKMAQIGSLWLTDLVKGDRFDEDFVAGRLEHGIGHVTRIGASTGLRPQASARLMNAIQRVATNRTRLGIPVMVHEEAVGGYCARGATQFPQAIGLASTWDEGLVEEVGDVIRRQMTAVGARHTLSPVLDVARDARWGRVEETYGEDPYLVGRMGTAYVRGVQSADLRHGVICTGKHFLGYSMSEGGMNMAPVQLGPRELREVYAEPFAAAIRDAGLASVMNSYSSIDGDPCAGSASVLDDLLRGELGFTGVVVADYFAVVQLMTHHRVAGTPGEAGARALRAGLDLELPGRDCFGDPLRPLLADGRLPTEVLDTAVRRVLRSKFQVGLFENPYVAEGSAVSAFDTQSDRDLARRAATASLTLLQNRGELLPLEADGLRTVAVIGPAADDQRLLQGDYHYPAHLEIMYDRPEADRSPSAGPSPVGGERYLPTDGGSFQPGPYFVDHVTPLAGIRAALPNAAVAFARGCEIRGEDRSSVDEAVRIAREADVALVFVGGRSGLLPHCTVGEARDASDLRLTGVQEHLVEAVVETGTPTVVVLLSGRVHSIASLAAKVPAIVQAWLPGEEGGHAIADVLLGRSEPGGRLPVSLPRGVGQVPLHHDFRAGGGKSTFWGDYSDGRTTPLFAFGHGLTYTRFEYGELQIVTEGSTSECIVLGVPIANVGGRYGTEVVQLYVRDEIASVARPDQQLIGFARVGLDPGSSAFLTFEVHPSRLAFYDDAMQFVTEPGTFCFMAGGSSDNASSTATVDLTGSLAHYLQREIVPTVVRIAESEVNRAATGTVPTAHGEEPT
jgi:beta-glucosidase-like glycosyl hydrolase